MKPSCGLVLLLFLSLSACVSGPSNPTTEYRAYLQAPAKRGRIVVYRPNDLNASKPVISVGDQKLRLHPDGFTYFDVEPGRHRVNVDWRWDQNVQNSSTDVSVRAGGTTFVSVTTGILRPDNWSVVGGLPIPVGGTNWSAAKEVAREQAEPELARTHYVPPPIR